MKTVIGSLPRKAVVIGTVILIATAIAYSADLVKVLGPFNAIIAERDEPMANLGLARTLLMSEKASLEERYGRNNLLSTMWHGPHRARSQQLFWQLLWEGRNLSVAVVGGSSTAGAWGIGGENTFPMLAGRWLSEFLLNISSPATVDVRNAAQGNADSVWASVCLDAYAGDAVDLLVWEFAINDRELGDSGRREGLEFFLRRAFTLYGSGLSVQLMFLWDSLHDNIWPPIFTTETADEFVTVPFAQEYDVAVFSGAKLFAACNFSQAETMNDAYHPNRFGHAVVADMYRFYWIEDMLAALDPDPTLALLSAPEPPRGAAAKRLWTPSFSALRFGAFWHTVQYSRSECVTGFAPRFKEPSTDLVFECPDAEQIQAAPWCSEDARVMVGKGDPRRFDRKYYWPIPDCSAPRNMTLRATLPIVRVLALNIAKGNELMGDWTDPKNVGVQVAINGTVLVPMVPAGEGLRRGRTGPNLWMQVPVWPERGSPFIITLCKTTADLRGLGTLAAFH